MASVDEAQDTLIKSRPLQSEERPFKRIAKRCSTLISSPTTIEEDFPKWKEDVNLDMEYFELTITRIQLLQDTNKREIERYEKEKVNILNANEKARQDMILLREELALAQQEKQNKLIYDTIAADILSNRALKPRDEQRINLARLELEISELEEEKRQYGLVWQARRQQFGEIVRQLEKMQSQIQEDKEEHDRREGMDEEEGEEGEEIEHPNRLGRPDFESHSGSTTPRSTTHTTHAATAAQTPTPLVATTNTTLALQRPAVRGNGHMPVSVADASEQNRSTGEGKDVTMEDAAREEMLDEKTIKKEAKDSTQANLVDLDRMDTT